MFLSKFFLLDKILEPPIALAVMDMDKLEWDYIGSGKKRIGKEAEKGDKTTKWDVGLFSDN